MADETRDEPGTASPLLTREEAAARLRVTPRTFDARVRPELPVVRIGRRVLFRVADVDAWIDEQAQGEAAPRVSRKPRLVYSRPAASSTMSAEAAAIAARLRARRAAAK